MDGWVGGRRRRGGGWVRVSNKVSSGKGNIKNMSLSFHIFFFFFTTFKTNDKKRDWISLFIRNKNDHQMESGRIWWGGGGMGGLDK